MKKKDGRFGIAWCQRRRMGGEGHGVWARIDCRSGYIPSLLRGCDNAGPEIYHKLRAKGSDCNKRWTYLTCDPGGRTSVTWSAVAGVDDIATDVGRCLGDGRRTWEYGREFLLGVSLGGVPVVVGDETVETVSLWL